MNLPMPCPLPRALTAAAIGLLVAFGAAAQEAQIRKSLAERLPPNFPKIDEVTKTPIPGLYEVRIGTEVRYTDAEGQYWIEGEITDLKAQKNLTEERVSKLTAIDFSALPLKDAVTYKQGNGARKLAVFADPNCGYCKRFEKDLLALKDVTIYTFLYPILGPDSNAKSRDIWCSKDAAKTWRAWMIDGVTPPKAMGTCDIAAIERNVDFGRKHRLQGTPAIVFQDGTRVPGAMPAEQVERRLVAAAKKS